MLILCCKLCQTYSKSHLEKLFLKYIAFRAIFVNFHTLSKMADLNTGGPHKWRVCLYVRNIKKCMGILKILNIINLYQVMSMLKPEINFNLSQLLCIVVSAVQNGEFERFGGFCAVCSTLIG